VLVVVLLAMVLGRLQSIVDLFRRHSKASLVLEPQEIDIDKRLVVVGLSFLQNSARAFIRKADDRPVLFSYGSDGTPLVARRIHVQQVSQETTVRRSGGQGVEFLVENAFLRSFDSLGCPSMLFLFKPPSPMSCGKSAWHCWQASLSFMPLLRQLGHSGIALSHYTFDRALYDSLYRKLCQSHEEYFAKLGDKDTDAELRLSWLRNWVIGTGCCLHDAQNGLAWGLKRFLNEGDDSLRNIYAVVAGLRAGYSELLQALPGFLQRHVRFVASDLDSAILTQFWQALDVPHEVVGVSVGSHACTRYLALPLA
jgi:hypothetical protein